MPLVINYVKGTLAIAHNGNLVNAIELREELSQTGAIFQTTIDSEVIAYLIARERLHTPTAEEAVKRAMQKIKGAYALVVSSPRKMIGARDPFGLKPLCIGKRDNKRCSSGRNRNNYKKTWNPVRYEYGDRFGKTGKMYF